MRQLRCILAAFFAILIVIPACCCASVAVPEKPSAKHSCCEGGGKEQKQKHEGACDCEAMTPRYHEGGAITSDLPVSTLPEPPPLAPEFRISSAAVHQVRQLPEEIDTGPPRLRLAVLQRFLI